VDRRQHVISRRQCILASVLDPTPENPWFNDTGENEVLRGVWAPRRGQQ